MAENHECRAPGCGRPAPAPNEHMFCDGHRAYFDASYAYDEWTTCAEELLPLFVRHAEALGNAALEEMFRENLERAQRETSRWSEELARAGAGLRGE